MKTLAELKAENLKRASEIEHITGVDDPEMLVKVREYLRHFVPPGPCVQCGYDLSSLFGFGGFVWGLVHGEGHCANCHYPLRVYHNLGDIGKVTMILQYHPDVLGESKTSTADTAEVN